MLVRPGFEPTTSRGSPVLNQLSQPVGGSFILIAILFCSYGDRAPKSIPARIFGIIWTLTGLVIISILVGAIASSLTSVTVEQDIMLYGTEVRLINILPTRGGDGRFDMVKDCWSAASVLSFLEEKREVFLSRKVLVIVA